jgi:predicted Zn-dependent protease
MRKFSLIILLIVAITIIQSCSTIPIIGRRQLNLLPESQLAAMSLTSYQEFLDTNNVISSGENYEMVKSTGRRISASVEQFMSDNDMEDRLKNFNWEYNLVDDPTPNAWAMPGGKIVFYDGIMPLCQNEDGVAVVMGHEIAHAVARHGNERMSQGLFAQLGGMALDVALSEQPEQTRNIFLSAYGLGSQVGVMLPYSRKHEYEADKLGLIFLTMAGYDPEESVRFWERMSALGDATVPEFLSTHPVSKKRVDALKKLLPEMEQYRP